MPDVIIQKSCNSYILVYKIFVNQSIKYFQNLLHGTLRSPINSDSVRFRRLGNARNLLSMCL